MIVFEYLYGMMDIFNPLMDEYAVKNINADEMVYKIMKGLLSCVCLFLSVIVLRYHSIDAWAG